MERQYHSALNIHDKAMILWVVNSIEQIRQAPVQQQVCAL